MNQVVALVPAFNPRAPELVATIDSLLQQSVAIDICIVDDGSKVEVQSPYPDDKRITILRMPANGGITRALQFGLAHCLDRGYAYIVRLDIGDLCHPDRVEKQVRFMEQAPDVGVLGARSRVMDLAGNALFIHGVAGGPDVVRKYLWLNSPFKHSTFCFRSTALREVGGYDPAYNVAQDYELLMRFARNGRVACLDDVLIDYVEDPAGLSSKKRGLQLRRRLQAQLAHRDLRAKMWYVGVMRSIVTIMVPRQLARRITLLSWGRAR